MIGYGTNKNDVIPEKMVIAGQIYLGTCGALENASLLLNKPFMEHFIETTLEESGEPHGRVSEDMTSRAVEYFVKYRELEDAMAITYPYFVEGLLSYALLGVDTNIIEEGDSETVIRFPVNR